MPQPTEADVTAWVKRKTFKCVMMNARMTRAACRARQARRAQCVVRFGVKVTEYDTEFDRYCRSGECPAGKRAQKGDE